MSKNSALSFLWMREITPPPLDASLAVCSLSSRCMSNWVPAVSLEELIVSLYQLSWKHTISYERELMINLESFQFHSRSVLRVNGEWFGYRFGCLVWTREGVRVPRDLGRWIKRCLGRILQWLTAGCGRRPGDVPGYRVVQSVIANIWYVAFQRMWRRVWPGDDPGHRQARCQHRASG